MNTVDYLASREDLVSPGISACQGCAAELSLRNLLKCLGRKTVLVVPPGCMAGAAVGGWNKSMGVKIPCAMPQLGNSASMLAGIKASYELVDPKVHCVAYAGDGGTADIGLQALSAAAERKNNIIYVCNDNEAYMNTGFQKSGTTPHGASTSTTPVGSVGRGKVNFKKDVPMMLAMQNAAYVATLCPAYMTDFVAKVQRAAEIKDGLVYLHILNPCPTGWGFDSSRSISLGRAAVQSRYFLLYEYRDYGFEISAPTRNIREPADVSEFLRSQKRFAHLGEEDLDEIRRVVQQRWDNLSRLAAN